MFLIFPLAAASDEGCWEQGEGLDAATSPFSYRPVPAKVSDVMLYASLTAGVGTPLVMDVRDTFGGRFAWRRTVGAVGATGVAMGSAFVAKAAVCRPRPYTYDPDGDYAAGDDHASFFSGHTTAAAVGSFSLATLAWIESGKDPAVAGFAFGGATAWTATMGALRVSAGKHYLSDVVLGGVIGAAAGVGFPLLVDALDVQANAQVSSNQVLLTVGGSW